MKCSGKQHPYPNEIDRLNKQMKDKQFEDVINQAKTNEENLKILSDKINKEFKSNSDSLQHFKNELKKVQKQLQVHDEIISWSQNWTVFTMDCWTACKQKGGQCDACNRGNATGYCCRPDGVGGNGDCPPQSILNISPSKQGHQCFING